MGSPGLRFNASTERVVTTALIVPAAVSMMISETTLSETISRTVPANWFRMLLFWLISKEVVGKAAFGCASAYNI